MSMLRSVNLVGASSLLTPVADGRVDGGKLADELVEADVPDVDDGSITEVNGGVVVADNWAPGVGPSFFMATATIPKTPPMIAARTVASAPNSATW